MLIYYTTREKQRSSLKAHKAVDFGKDSPKGKRYARQLVKPVKAPVTFSVQEFQNLITMNAFKEAA
jgi:hypothetical protein